MMTKVSKRKERGVWRGQMCRYCKSAIYFAPHPDSKLKEIKFNADDHAPHLPRCIKLTGDYSVPLGRK